jgi:hypothetical protein
LRADGGAQRQDSHDKYSKYASSPVLHNNLPLFVYGFLSTAPLANLPNLRMKSGAKLQCPLSASCRQIRFPAHWRLDSIYHP